MQNTTQVLSKQLHQYGLNPQEWRIQWLKPNFKKSIQNKQFHHLKIVNEKDSSFYFTAEAQIEPRAAKWQSLSLVSL